MAKGVEPELEMKNAFLISILLVLVQSGHAQGFVNLDFEDAVITQDSNPHEVNASDAIPAWTAYINGVPQTDIIYDTINLDSAGISIHDTSTDYFPPLQGNYSIFLQGDNNADPINYPAFTKSASIGQYGQVSPIAKSMTFYGYNLVRFQLTFNGINIPYYPVGSEANYTIYGADISADAGQTGQLVFTALYNGGGILDNIQFSQSSVPEPSEFALVTMGTLLLSFCRRRRC